MVRALKYLFILVILGMLGLIVYAYFTELPPPTREVERSLPAPAPAGQ